jgi:superfamily II DNA or RNA helicase
MSKICTLVIHDQVNVSFKNLDPKTRRDCSNALKFFIHAARHMPAFKLGRWDGCVTYFALNGNTYFNLLDKVLPVIAENGYNLEAMIIEDHRQDYVFDFPAVDEEYVVENAPNPVWPVGHPAAGQAIRLRDYQVQAIDTFLQNPQCLQELATGAGKTLITATLSHLCEPYGRTVIIVPNKSLVDQTEADYKNLGLDVGVYYGDRKEPGHQHTVCTWQSLHILDKNSKKGVTATQLDIETFTKDVICVMVDEVHQAKAEVLKNLLCGPFANVPIRWGLTGTIPKDEHEFTSILSSLGPVRNYLAAHELMSQGVLANLNISIMQLLDTVAFESFHEEYNYLVSDRTRLDWMSEFVIQKSKSGNTLVLVNRIETGKELESRIPGSKFVYGATKQQDRKDSYDEIKDSDNLVLIASYGVAAVGINIPRIFNLMMIEPGKSFTRVIQSIGRGIRKAADKDFVDVYDIASNCKFSARHMKKRKADYKEAKYPHQVIKVDYQKEMK